jgi:hypothetical protein
MKRTLAATALAIALIAAAALAPAAPARRTTAVVPNGTYGVNQPARGEYVVFTVRNRRVRNLEFQMQITCQASDSPPANNASSPPAPWRRKAASSRATGN